MNDKDILRKLETIFEDIIEDGTVLLTSNTTADDIEGWDSLTHMEIITAIEKELNIQFTSLEIGNFQNIGDICSTILQKSE